ncbi:single-stranded-DNA-specific exonuclease RecJ [Streptococcus urinalis FB127-CNA-2]|uniref:Single-stranded-DNA-specific exonuclease RecJ n=1 Tax=Streptococcus urinalis 2285-97 TaxID=764291 RepID=G5KH26_9STRE|nr:single-stranded-DNA-specific exonuclease RecJ [Streptococcus urinalis]EHJ56230.1 single-stranded-DNA-specific exonuclease RecJ [Streptococcus urinalis 2285-97]EKS22466.1 single-stranded-DNA-specific exonuclease RecJ [Streptococcus urinalis FB127-CNA-2]VEF32279.1 Single-stranded-DNA-specific exonuclease RecJ [Streptococcus urinalis]
MIKSKYDWIISETKTDEKFLKAAKKLGLDDLTASIAYQRGIQSEASLSHFLNDNLSDLHDPFLLHDMEKSVERIRLALSRNEKILVYGDYDADGMTSASIMKETFEMLGAQAIIYLPNRFTDGYGPNLSVYKYYIEQEAVSLIVTVDNGVSGHEAIHFAQENNVDVIVTDHHGLPETLPEAFAIIHPEHPEGNYPFPYLAGCGVAFKLACALLESIPDEMLDLVAIGTIADMVNLEGENRIMVRLGLEMFKMTDRLGLQELLNIENVSSQSIDSDTIGFKIAPQLNALGRLDDPNPAIELLTGFDDDIVTEIAQLVSSKNDERKALVDTIYQEAITLVDKEKPVQVLAKENWHPGVLGIVAGRLMEDLGQTIIVLDIKDGFAKGSARSIESLNIFEVLNQNRHLFEAVGGHAGAAGMTIAVEHIQSLSDILCQYVLENNIDTRQKSPLKVDYELIEEILNLKTIKILDQLAPFGMSNPKPLFYMKDFEVLTARTMGQDNKHLKLKIKKGQFEGDVVAFNQGFLNQEFQQATQLELIVTMSVNQWNGNTSLQLMLEDARVNGVQLIDLRHRNAQIPEGVTDIFEVTEETSEVIITEIPDKPEELRSLFLNNKFQSVYFKNRIIDAYYLTGYGTREQYAKLYKTIYQFPEFDIRYKIGDLAHYLKIDHLLLIKMIQIFEELQFVSITNGLMTVNKEATKKKISESQIYQRLKETVAYQELMALGSPREIYEWLTS